jgi:hypothetical protein
MKYSVIIFLILVSFFFLTDCEKADNENNNCVILSKPENNDLLVIDEAYGQKPNYNGFTQIEKTESGFFYRRLNNVPKRYDDLSINYTLFGSGGSNSFGRINNYGQIVWEKTLDEPVTKILSKYDENQNRTFLIVLLNNPDTIPDFDSEFEIHFYSIDGNLEKKSTIQLESKVALTDVKNFNEGLLITGGYVKNEDIIPYLLITDSNFDIDTILVFDTHKGKWIDRVIVQNKTGYDENIISFVGRNSQTSKVFALSIEINMFLPSNWEYRYSKEYGISSSTNIFYDAVSGGNDFEDGYYAVGSYSSSNSSLKPFAMHIDGNGEIIWQNSTNYTNSDANATYKTCIYDQSNNYLITGGYHAKFFCDKWYGNGLISVIQNGDVVNNYTLGNKDHENEILSIQSDGQNIYFGGFINTNSTEAGTEGWFGIIYR